MMFPKSAEPVGQIWILCRNTNRGPHRQANLKILMMKRRGMNEYQRNL